MRRRRDDQPDLMRQTFFLALFALALTTTVAQRKPPFTRVFQFSLLPGIGSNGMHGGGFHNYFSLNLTSGYSASANLLEVGGISNLNTDRTRGLQLAGLANITGGDAFAGIQDRDRDQKIRGGFEANLSGFQVAGLANVVLNNVFGAQFTAGVNVARGALLGVQVAGISNTDYKYAFGVQLAGVYNVAARSMDGVQLSSLFNITEGELYGLQLALFNRAGVTEGINSRPETDDPSGVQIGLVNVARKVNGFQIGLINKAGRMQGTQVGLVNIFNGGKTPQTRDGTAVGLINTGNAAYVAAYASELFLANVELATGTVKNGRVTSDATIKQVMNALIYARNPSSGVDRNRWAVGYGLKKMIFNRSMMPGMGMIRYFSFGLDILHINRERKKFTRALSLLTRPVVSVGSRLHPKNRSFYFFLRAAYNFYWSDTSEGVEPLFAGRQRTRWPGFAAGVLVR